MAVLSLDYLEKNKALGIIEQSDGGGRGGKIFKSTIYDCYKHKFHVRSQFGVELTHKQLTAAFSSS